MRFNWQYFFLGAAVAAGAILAALDARSAPAETRIIDGDTIVQNGVHYRLYGIDAPELAQSCSDGWPAGAKAKGFLLVLIHGLAVTCDNRGLDRYGRTLAVCHAGDDKTLLDSVSLNQAMVRSGNAWAYTHYARDYLADEIAARADHLGVHAHACQPAWDWRHSH